MTRDEFVNIISIAAAVAALTIFAIGVGCIAAWL